MQGVRSRMVDYYRTLRFIACCCSARSSFTSFAVHLVLTLTCSRCSVSCLGADQVPSRAKRPVRSHVGNGSERMAF